MECLVVVMAYCAWQYKRHNHSSELKLVVVIFWLVNSLDFSGLDSVHSEYFFFMASFLQEFLVSAGPFPCVIM